MHNFVFHNPTKVLFGRGTLNQFANEAGLLGRRLLMVYGRNSAKKSGLIDRLTAALDQSNLEVHSYGGVAPNPTVGHVRGGIELAKQYDVEAIIGVGGGSVIDSAKAIAAGSLAAHDVWKFFTGKKSVKEALPVLAVPTLAGSGSEMNPGMVLTNNETQQKFGFAHRLLHPKTAIVDPELTFTLPRSLVAYGAVDALSHLLEIYLNSAATNSVIQDGYIEGLAQSIITSCNRAVADNTDYDAHANLLWAAGLALNGIAAAGLGKIGFPMHLIEHPLSALFNLPHGAGLGAIIPGWLRCHSPDLHPRISKLLQVALCLENRQEISADMAIEVLACWLRSIGVPTSLAEAGINEVEIDTIAENALPLAKIWRMKGYDLARISYILQQCR